MQVHSLCVKNFFRVFNVWFKLQLKVRVRYSTCVLNALHNWKLPLNLWFFMAGRNFPRTLKAKFARAQLKTFSGSFMFDTSFCGIVLDVCFCVMCNVCLPRVCVCVFASACMVVGVCLETPFRGERPKPPWPTHTDLHTHQGVTPSPPSAAYNPSNICQIPVTIQNVSNSCIHGSQKYSQPKVVSVILLNVQMTFHSGIYNPIIFSSLRYAITWIQKKWDFSIYKKSKNILYPDSISIVNFCLM